MVRELAGKVQNMIFLHQLQDKYGYNNDCFDDGSGSENYLDAFSGSPLEIPQLHSPSGNQKNHLIK